MNKKGQLQFEAMACFAIFLAILGLFASVLNAISGQSEQALDALKGKAEAEACCFAADSIFSSNIQELLEKNAACTAEKNTVKDSWEKESVCVAGDIRVVQAGGKRSLEVQLSGHYK